MAHHPSDKCEDPWCPACGARACPSGEPLHDHRDGCPACADPEAWARAPLTEAQLDAHHRAALRPANPPSDGMARVKQLFRLSGP